MIAVRPQAHARGHLSDFAEAMLVLPEVLNVSPGRRRRLLRAHRGHQHDGLRDFVVNNLSANPDVALTATNLIFEHVRATGAVHD